MLKKVKIYSDGAARGNPDGPGGYGAILQYTDASGTLHEKELSEGFKKTTNNQMELLGVIKALECLRVPCTVDVYSDSKYVVSAFNENWIEGWQRKGWVNSAKHPVANKDLWLELIEQCNIHKVNFIKVKGHADNEFNNRCDELAVAESQKFSKG